MHFNFAIPKIILSALQGKAINRQEILPAKENLQTFKQC